MQVGTRNLGPGEPTFLVAEIGNNHDGSLRQAEALLRAAADAGADAVKFQTHIAEAEMLPSTPTPPHFDEPRYAFMQRMELSLDEHLQLRSRAEELGVVFFSSPFSVEAVDLLEQVGVPLYKVASGEVTNPPLLEAVARTGKPVLLSTGMSALSSIDRAVEIFKRAGTELVVLQCTSSYPCPPEKVNLRAMVALGARYECPVGLSDHTPGIYSGIAAVALGAVCVEKHFTLSRRLYGPDHHASLEPDDFQRLVEGVRHVESALGDGVKESDPAHDAVRAAFEKSVVVRVPIVAGATIEASMLTTKRPGTGIPATSIPELIGRSAARDLEANQLLEAGDVV